MANGLNIFGLAGSEGYFSEAMYLGGPSADLFVKSDPENLLLCRLLFE
nr:hypothetical protein [Alteribacillus bidgolensis]